jgi:hypothetical protein
MKKIIILKNNKRNRAFAEKMNSGIKYNKVRVILMSTVAVVKQVKGSIDFKDSKQKRLERALEIHKACSSSIYVTFSAGMLDDYKGTITDFGKASTKTRPAKFTKMNNFTQKLLSVVQPLADDDPKMAKAILDSCSFHCKTYHGKKVKAFAGKPGMEDGSVDLESAGGPKKKSHLHQWYSSLDGLIFKREQATNAAKTHIKGLPSGTYGYFMEELSVQDKLKGLSQIIKVLIK